MFLLLVIYSCALCSCAHTKEEEQTVAIPPVDVLGLSADQGSVVRTAVEGRIDALPDCRTTPSKLLTLALPEQEEERANCLDSDVCLAEVGRKVNADLVLGLKLAGLGGTNVIRARLVDAGQGIVVQDLQETVVGGSQELEGRAQQLALRLFPAPEAAWYERWWIWAAVATAVGGATTVAVLIVRDGDDGSTHIGDLP